MDTSSRFRWQTITLATLFTGYTGYYICRSNLSVAAPLILAEYEGTIDKAALGSVASMGVLFYAIGKISNGYLADALGGKLLFLMGMVVSVLCTILFGLGAGLTTFLILWGANRYFQSMGWGALVNVSSRWYPVVVHARIMGILSMSYLVGDAFARFYLGGCIQLGADWRQVFYISAATLGAIALVSFFTLKGSPRDIGLEEPTANPNNLYGEEGNSSERVPFLQLVRPFLRNPVFWLVCAMNFGLTLIRETFNFWTPTYLHQEVGFTVGDAAQVSLFFPLTGGIAALSTGWLCDRLQGRHGRVVVPTIAVLVVAMGALGLTSLAGQKALAVALIVLVAFFLIAPYSLLSGVMALDLGGKRGCSTAAGLIDSAGYLGAVLSGQGIGLLAQYYGWQTAFVSLAGVAAVTLLVSIAYWYFHENSPRVSNPDVVQVKQGC